MSKSIVCEAPSNIAFVKYWGKYGRQYPLNPSLSMTLSHCKTKCKIDYRLDKGKGKIESFLFEGKENEKFKTRIENYLYSIKDVYKLADDLVLNIETENTFPHSAGIASSASAMAALCLCLASIENPDNYQQRASYLSRLASGSACRSIYSNYAIWGKNDFLDSSDEYATAFSQVHENFNSLCDSILIVSSSEKEVSSSQGHALMNTHFYREGRLAQANENFRVLVNAMKIGDFDSFGVVLENEALSLHALMMSSYPSFCLLKPASLEIIQKIRHFRQETNIPCYFTIDAGPNIHLIYPSLHNTQVKDFISHECSEHLENVIHDKIGLGASRL